MIEFESVGKTFRDGTAAVVDLSLTAPSGKITVIVGPSGCGKTTTLRMVNRMLEPTSGRITWDGSPLKSRRKTALRRQMGYVIQSGGLFPHRTVLDNIGTVPGLLRWDKSKTDSRSRELLASVGLDRNLGYRFPAQLSGGQQQRVGVARALAADPMVLLMDEPFSAVDPVVRSELHEFFLNLQREISKTIILITHDIDEAIKLGDRVAILRIGGRLAQVGTPQEVLDEPADAFVEGFVGRDRGYRSLSFLPASGLSLESVKVVRDVETAPPGEPTLVVDGDARPVGWADPSRPGQVFALGATFSPGTDTMRVALDSALTSPLGLAIAVAPDTGRFAGVVSADKILAQVTQSRAGVAESISVRAAEAAGRQGTGGSDAASPKPEATEPEAIEPEAIEPVAVPAAADVVRDRAADAGPHETNTAAADSETQSAATPRDDETVVLGGTAVDVGPEQTPAPAAAAAAAVVEESPDPPAEPIEAGDREDDHRSSVHDHEDGEDDLANADDPESGVEPASVDLLSDGREVIAEETPSPRAGNR